MVLYSPPKTGYNPLQIGYSFIQLPLKCTHTPRWGMAPQMGYSPTRLGTFPPGGVIALQDGAETPKEDTASSRWATAVRKG